MAFKKFLKTSLCLSAAVISLGISQKVSAAPAIESDVGIAGITPVIESYYTSNSESELGEAEEYLINLLLQLDRTNGTNLVENIHPYANLGISNTNNFVYIRTEPNTESEKAGKLHSGAAAEILAKEDEWYKVKSGSIEEGYIHADYLAVGSEAEALIDDVAKEYAIVTATTLRVREEPNTECDVLTNVSLDGKYLVVGEQEDWVKIKVDDITGFVSKDYINIEQEFDHAISVEEERAIIAAEEARREEEARRAEEKREAEAEAKRKAEEKKRREAQKKAKKKTKKVEVPATSANGTAKGREIVNYALKFVGNKYVYGGNSLTNGIDCSGFTKQIYEKFGYNFAGNRSASSQSRNVGYEVNESDRQPGDLIFYTKGGRVSHVAIYMGNNKIVHASNSRDGIKIGNRYNYNKPYKIKRVVK